MYFRATRQMISVTPASPKAAPGGFRVLWKRTNRRSLVPRLEKAAGPGDHASSAG